MQRMWLSAASRALKATGLSTLAECTSRMICSVRTRLRSTNGFISGSCSGDSDSSNAPTCHKFILPHILVLMGYLPKISVRRAHKNLRCATRVLGGLSRVNRRSSMNTGYATHTTTRDPRCSCGLVSKRRHGPRERQSLDGRQPVLRSRRHRNS